MRCVCDRIPMSSSSTTMYKKPIERRVLGQYLLREKLEENGWFSCEKPPVNNS